MKKELIITSVIITLIVSVIATAGVISISPRDNAIQEYNTEKAAYDLQVQNILASDVSNEYTEVKPKNCKIIEGEHYCIIEVEIDNLGWYEVVVPKDGDYNQAIEDRIKYEKIHVLEKPSAEYEVK